MVTYAAYAPPDIDLRQAALVTIVSDTDISFLAGLAVFPVVFAEGLDPSSGPGLMFVSVPLAFDHIPFGGVAAMAFFVLLTVATLASAMSLLEMPVAFLQRQFGWPRPLATWVAAGACWTVGLGSILSFNRWADWFPLAALPGFATSTVNDLLDYLTSNLLLPAGGFALAILGGWVVPTAILAEELGLNRTSTVILRVLVRYATPVAIAAATLAPLIL
ncbi:MAG: hypothetical protein EXQ85_09010 [Alphaproteobacteria bacterium]|nr:hypothetical protein [Alphaproteobacteria bacterium]